MSISSVKLSHMTINFVIVKIQAWIMESTEAARGWGFWGRVGAFPDGLRGFGGRAPQPPEASQTFFYLKTSLEALEP